MAGIAKLTVSAFAAVVLLSQGTIAADEPAERGNWTNSTINMTGATMVQALVAEELEDVQVQRQRVALRGSVVAGEPPARGIADPVEGTDVDSEAHDAVTGAAGAVGRTDVAPMSFGKPMTKTVACVCKRSRGDLFCGGAFYELGGCDSECSAICHRHGVAEEGCNGPFELQWFARLHYRYVGC